MYVLFLSFTRKNKPALSWFDSHTADKYLALDTPGALKKVVFYIRVDILTHSGCVRRHVWSHCQIGTIGNVFYKKVSAARVKTMKSRCLVFFFVLYDDIIFLFNIPSKVRAQDVFKRSWLSLRTCTEATNAFLRIHQRKNP